MILLDSAFSFLSRLLYDAAVGIEMLAYL